MPFHRNKLPRLPRIFFAQARILRAMCFGFLFSFFSLWPCSRISCSRSMIWNAYGLGTYCNAPPLILQYIAMLTSAKSTGSDHLTNVKMLRTSCTWNSAMLAYIYATHTHTHTHTHTSIFPHCETTTCPINSSMVDHWCQCIRINCILASYWNKAWEDASWGNMSGATRSHTQPSAYFQPAIDMLHGWHACYPTCTSASVHCIQAEMTLCNMSMWLINTKLRPPTVASQFSNLNFVTNREHYIVWRSHIYWEHLLFFFSAHERDVWEWTCAIRVTWQGSSHARPYPQKNANTATGVTKEMKAHNMGHAWSVMSCIQQV